MPQATTRFLVVAVAFAAITVLCSVGVGVGDAAEWIHLCGLLLLTPVFLAAFWFDRRGGLLAGIGGALICLQAHVRLSRTENWTSYVEALIYPVAGLVGGWLASRERSRSLAWKTAVHQLTSAHTELRNSFEAMKRAERLFSLGQLSAGLAHEIRNPLASIAGAVRILRRNVPSGAKQVECMDIIEKESQRLNRLLTNFLDFAKPRPPRLQPVDVGSVFDTVITLATHGLGRESVELRKMVEPSLPHPECDSEQLQQVLLNLTINAIQASADDAEVILAAHHGLEGEIEIEVRDQGVGVSPENVDRLFDPFFTTKENGTGLGLPVAHEIVRQFGGTLSARRNPDRGMTFNIALPLRAQGINETEADTSGR
ncbi:MAG TPA: ATP-binding protein [Bryobacteraceae bacterium]|nr:ATP-binding protein [Bryobacteraceae bacterium]